MRKTIIAAKNAKKTIGSMRILPSFQRLNYLMLWKHAAHVFCDEFIFDLLQIPKLASVSKQQRTEEKFPSLEVIHSFTLRYPSLRLLSTQYSLPPGNPQGCLEELVTFGNPEGYPNALYSTASSPFRFSDRNVRRPRPTGIPQAVT